MKTIATRSAACQRYRSACDVTDNTSAKRNNEKLDYTCIGAV
jgi:hypothetical protein